MGMCGHLFDDSADVSEHSLNLFLREIAGVATQLQDQLVGGYNPERKRIVCFLNRADILDLQAVSVFLLRRLDWIVLKDHHGFKEGETSGDFAPSLHFHQRAILISS